jgi:hypothetical protein
MMNGASTPGTGTTSPYTMINGYPTMNGNYFDCEGNIDNDMAHHTTDPNDTDPGHNVGKNCPGGMPKMPKMNMDAGQMFMPGMLNHPMFGVWNGSTTEDWVIVPLTSELVMKMAGMMNM